MVAVGAPMEAFQEEGEEEVEPPGGREEALVRCCLAEWSRFVKLSETLFTSIESSIFFKCYTKQYQDID